MKVVKSDGKVEEFDSHKIKQNVLNAYQKVGETANEIVIDLIINNLFLYENIKTKDIRKQMEDALMSINKNIAKQYIQMHGKSDENKNKFDFIKNYIKSSNASTGSKFDSNANVSMKNVVTMGQELYKDNSIRLNRWLLSDKIKSMYSKKLATKYIEDIESHRLYKHDETAVPGMPYCVAINMYPFLLDGLTKLGGESTKPTDLKSYCGEFVNLVYSISSQFAGAVATPEFLMYMDYFIRKDYGDDYIYNTDKIVDLSKKQRTIEQIIENCFQQVVHSMNMPAGTRGYQTVFWNIGYFDKYYFEGLFDGFLFPDGDAPKWETLSWLQKKFMNWFNEERNRYVLTFPVETMALLTDNEKPLDEDYGDFSAEMLAKGHSFFCYLSDSPDSLSSCCRLRNDISTDKVHNKTTHQFSMGTASIATGSKSVMTININQVIQESVNNTFDKLGLDKNNIVDGYKLHGTEILSNIKIDIANITTNVHKYQTAFNEIIKDFLKFKMLTVYMAGFIDIKKQYLTIGVNGLTDAAEFLGIEVSDNSDYELFVNSILETINICNASAKTHELMFNTEFVPGESLSSKNYDWNKKAGFKVSDKHNMYSSYFYNPEDSSLTIIDKMKLHGSKYVKYLDGGSACHININEHMTKDQYKQLIKTAIHYGTNYFTFNCKNTVCNDCGYISKHTLSECPKCNSKNLDFLTRIIGYLKRVSSFNEQRQIEESTRNYSGL